MANMRDTYVFLKSLAVNNNREWFNEHKDEYLVLREMWETDLARLISLMSDWCQDLRGLQVKESAYRIYRDIRFSSDKSPYKTYFSAVIGRRGRKCVQAGFYLHMEPGNSALYAGIWWPETPILTKLRSEIDANADEFKSILAHPELSSKFKFTGDRLKSLPRGYSKDNPNAEFIKMKEYICEMKVVDDYFFCEDWVEKVAKDFSRAKNFNEFLNYIFAGD